MDYDNFSIPDIHKELSKLHEEFVISLRQDRHINKIKEISTKIDLLLYVLTNNIDLLSAGTVETLGR